MQNLRPTPAEESAIMNSLAFVWVGEKIGWHVGKEDWPMNQPGTTGCQLPGILRAHLRACVTIFIPVLTDE